MILNPTEQRLCIRCYAIYEFEKRCCYDRTYVKIDEPIISLISMLNKLGYKTTHSCSGHYDYLLPPFDLDSFTGSKEIYISFDKNVTLPSLPDGFIRLYKKDMPKPSMTGIQLRENTKARQSKDPFILTYEERKEEHMNSLFYIYKWARNLVDERNSRILKERNKV